LLDGDGLIPTKPIRAQIVAVLAALARHRCQRLSR
jgi:hypothetical protein